eukprot:scaffold60805_cov32-Attheya_sp.AAC.1
MEVDFNQNNKRLGRNMMKMAEAHGGLAKEQYGSHKHHAANEQALNKRLTFDLICLLKCPSVNSAMDLRSNYDLVLHAAASISMQRQGMPEQPIIFMFTTLQDMTHRIKTAFGESDLTWG